MRISLVLMILFATPVFAASTFKGFPKAAKDKSIEVKGQLINLTENKDEFLIGLDKQAAFFLFPKNAADQVNIRDFLTNIKAKKKTLTLEVNPRNTQIYYLKSE